MLNNKRMSVGGGVNSRVYKQACFLVISGPKGDEGRMHLHVCMNTAKVGEMVLLLSVQTWKDANRDQPKRYRRLFVGDHDFLKHDSCIDFAYPELYPADKILKADHAGRNWIRQKPFDHMIFNSLLVQFYESRFAKTIHRKMLQQEYDALKKKPASATKPIV